MREVVSLLPTHRQQHHSADKTQQSIIPFSSPKSKIILQSITYSSESKTIFLSTAFSVKAGGGLSRCREPEKPAGENQPACRDATQGKFIVVGGTHLSL
jgi:hypothetical protein